MDEWIRDGGRVCLDFANTLRDRWKEPRETLTSPAELALWLRGASLLDARSAADDGLLAVAWRLREAIDRAVLAAAQDGLPVEADLALINDAAEAAPRPPLRVRITAGRLAAETATGVAGEVRAALGLVAQDALTLLLSPEVRWVRVCGSDRCALRFLDRSPARNRRWCSMARCGNRTKVRRHQSRTRS